MRRNLSYYCLHAPRIHIFVLHAHPVRGESHNQRNTTGEVATAQTFVSVMKTKFMLLKNFKTTVVAPAVIVSCH